MATAPWFVLGPNTLLSLYGLIRGPDRTVPTPAEDWRQAVVDVVIPCFREEDNIVLCLASVAGQTFKVRQVILVDDGSGDRTVERAKSFAERAGLSLIVIQRATSIGKTPTIKRQAREFDHDVEFILDADTFLEDERYIERCVEELYQGVGIASACGTILPMRQRDRDALAARPALTEHVNGDGFKDPFLEKRRGLKGIWWRLTNIYRETLYLFLQRFIYRGQMVFCGSITNPVGCAVAYRRKYIVDLFDKYEPLFGDDLTNSEDIFIGFALNSEGYRNIQLDDVVARTEEPEAGRVPRQLYLWSSSFLQSCYYFDPLLRSPFKTFQRWRRRRRETHGEAGHEIQNKRLIKEQYRQAFGEQVTVDVGRPVGWVILLSAMEKIGFPTALIVLILMGWWEPLAVTILAEAIISVGVLVAISKGQRIRAFFKALLVAPIRYLLLIGDMITILRFAGDLWITGNRKWRK